MVLCSESSACVAVVSKQIPLLTATMKRARHALM